MKAEWDALSQQNGPEEGVVTATGLWNEFRIPQEERQQYPQIGGTINGIIKSIEQVHVTIQKEGIRTKGTKIPTTKKRASSEQPSPTQAKHDMRVDAQQQERSATAGSPMNQQMLDAMKQQQFDQQLRLAEKQQQQKLEMEAQHAAQAASLSVASPAHLQQQAAEAMAQQKMQQEQQHKQQVEQMLTAQQREQSKLSQVGSELAPPAETAKEQTQQKSEEGGPPSVQQQNPKRSCAKGAGKDKTKHTLQQDCTAGTDVTAAAAAALLAGKDTSTGSCG